MAPTLLPASFATTAAGPPFRREGIVGEAEVTTLLRAGVGGALGCASPEELERIGSVVRSVSGFVLRGDVGDGEAGGLSGRTQGPARETERSGAGYTSRTFDDLWNSAEDAVFLFRRGDTLGAGSILVRALQELRLGRGAVLAAHLLLSYFVQRVLELASEAGRTRRTLEKACLREEAS